MWKSYVESLEAGMGWRQPGAGVGFSDWSFQSDFTNEMG